jgi:beta-glucosidase-like glycosyl hydrolase
MALIPPFSGTDFGGLPLEAFMPFSKFSAAVFVFSTAYLLSACTPGALPHDLTEDRDHEKDSGFYMASAADPKQAQDPVRSKLSYFFLVEQFDVAANASMITAIKNNPPGGILFWNHNAADSALVRDSVKAYSEQASKVNLKPLLFSTDYEGGALRKTPTGSDIPGVQRFTKGFTSLAHPRWLGYSMQKYGTELCTLHGKIMSEELKAAGINYPLSVVSDLATQALTSARGISKDSDEVSLCITKILEAFAKTQDLIFVTKHFPGLGLTRGDTHDGTVTAVTEDPAVLAEHLKPFQQLIETSKAEGNEGLLSVMTTHAKFLAYDRDHVTTESPKIVKDLLKGKLAFRGLVVSDAMWMGEYGKMKSDELMPVYLNTFLSGLDLLMIPGVRFAEAVNYFRKVYDGSLTDAEKEMLTRRTGMSWEETHGKFLERITESLETADRARSAIKAPHTYVKAEVPSSLTVGDRTRYNQILSELSVGAAPVRKN